MSWTYFQHSKHRKAKPWSPYCEITIKPTNVLKFLFHHMMKWMFISVLLWCLLKNLKWAANLRVHKWPKGFCFTTKNRDIWAFFLPSKPIPCPPVRLPVISKPHHHASSYIPHSTGLGFPEWHLQLSSKECRYQRQSRIQFFFQRYPVQTYIHSCYRVLQQTLPPGQSFGCEVGRKSEREDRNVSGISHSMFTNANETRDLTPNQKAQH